MKKTLGMSAEVWIFIELSFVIVRRLKSTFEKYVLDDRKIKYEILY